MDLALQTKPPPLSASSAPLRLIDLDFAPVRLTQSSCATTLVIMKNVTISLEDDVARWVRVLAARNEKSVSRLVGELLKGKMQAEHGYESALRDYLSCPPTPLKTSGGYPSRDELHAR